MLAGIQAYFFLLVILYVLNHLVVALCSPPSSSILLIRDSLIDIRHIQNGCARLHFIRIEFLIAVDFDSATAHLRLIDVCLLEITVDSLVLNPCFASGHLLVSFLQSLIASII